MFFVCLKSVRISTPNYYALYSMRWEQNGRGGGGTLLVRMPGSFSLWQPTCMHCGHLALWTRILLCGSFYEPYKFCTHSFITKDMQTPTICRHVMKATQNLRHKVGVTWQTKSRQTMSENQQQHKMICGINMSASPYKPVDKKQIWTASISWEAHRHYRSQQGHEHFDRHVGA